MSILAAREAKLASLHSEVRVLSHSVDTRISGADPVRGNPREANEGPVDLEKRRNHARGRAYDLREELESERKHLEQMARELDDHETHLEASRIRCELEVERAAQLSRLKVPSPISLLGGRTRTISSGSGFRPRAAPLRIAMAKVILGAMA
jgi:hypothetical protein